MSESVPSKLMQAASSGERKHVTVLFADLVGFTAISEQLGEEATFNLIQPIYDLMASAVREEGGLVSEFAGDGIMALFGVPNALEDAPPAGLPRWTIDQRTTRFGSRYARRRSTLATGGARRN